MSELLAVPVPVRPGAGVRARLPPCRPCRVVGPCRHAGTGQEGVVVEGPLPGMYTYHTLEAFARLFEPAGPLVPEKVADQRSRGSGF